MIQIEHNSSSSEVVTLDKNKKSSAQKERAYKLKKLVDEIEKFEAQKSAINEAIKATYDAASAAGFDKKALKQVVSDRQKDQQELELFESNVSELKETVQWAEENPRWKKAV